MYTSDVRKLTQLPDPLKKLCNVNKKYVKWRTGSNFYHDYVNLDVPGCNSYKQIDCNPLLKLYTNSSGLNDRMVSYDRK